MLRLTAACDPAGTGGPPLPAAEPRTGEFRATWYDRFQRGCLTYQLHSTSDVEGSFTAELPALLGFATRDALHQALRRRSDGRLRLDPVGAVIRYPCRRAHRSCRHPEPGLDVLRRLLGVVADDYQPRTRALARGFRRRGPSSSTEL